MATVTVLWFAHLRDQRGRDEERIDTTAPTVRALYAELCARHGLTYPERNLVAAIDETMVRWDAPLPDGATVVFLPPVSGG